MKHEQFAAVQTDEPDDTADQRAADAAAEATPRAENPLSKFEVQTLKGITSSAVIEPGVVAFLPHNMGEAMEFAKVMCQGNFVPPHLRGKPGDCLAIVLQSARWGADPFAVASKTYFVNDRMAYEAQLVNAVVNSSKVLDGRLNVSWNGSGPTLDCTVRGKIRGDDDIHELTLESAKITTKNSPLWKQAEKVQLAYYTMRAWARLFTPEVMLGIYTPDELEAETVMNPDTGTQQVIPPRPTRESVKAEKEAAERMRKEQVQNEGHARSIARETDHDPETGEVIEDEPEDSDAAEEQGSAQAEETAQQTVQTKPTAPKNPDFEVIADMLIEKINKASMPKALNAILQDYGAELDTLRTEAPTFNAEVQAAIKARRDWFSR